MTQRRRGHEESMNLNKESIIKEMSIKELQDEVQHKIEQKYNIAEQELRVIMENIKNYQIPKECFTDNDILYQKKIEEMLMEIIKIINAKCPKSVQK